MTEAKAVKGEVIYDNSAENDTTEVAESPSPEQEQKPSTEPEMLTKEQAEKLANERHSKLDKKISELTNTATRLENTAKAAESRATAAQQQLENAQKRLDEAERKSLGNSPDAVKLFEEQVKLRQRAADIERREAELARREADNASDIAEAKQYRITQKADALAKEYGVDATLLVTLTDGTPDKMEKLAQSLPKKTSGDDPKMPKKPDSGKSSSGYGNLTNEQLEKLPMDQYKQMVEERSKRK
jgi:chromosome segregation ATPase